MTTLDILCETWGVHPLGLTQPGVRRMPIEIRNIGRDDLATLCARCGFAEGVEVGVEQGAYSEILCRANPQWHLTCVDAWQAYQGYREHVSQEKLDAFYKATQARLRPYQCTVLRAFSLEAARQVRDRSVDFVYIDANHTLPHVIADLHAWLPKVRSGGIVAGHDFCKRKDNGYQVHVVEAVHAWTEAYHVYPWFVLGAKAVRPEDTRDRPRSWMWVVP